METRSGPMPDPVFSSYQPYELPVGVNGIMPLPLRGNVRFHVLGGPYRNRPANTWGIKLAEEINLPADLKLDIADFSTPPMDDLVDAVQLAVQAICRGEAVYAGCRGGIGRTGMFLACLAKSFGVEAPVAFVRKTYLSTAVETKDQRDMVHAFRPSAKTLSMIRWAKLKSFVGLQKGLFVD